MPDNISYAKEVLDRLISKQRVHMYKPIQVAEILYRVRDDKLTYDQVENNPEAYRNPSKHWRDSVSRVLLDQISTSSQKFQDNLFEKNAVPPEILVILARSNTDGIVERYIYQKFRKKQHQILKIGKILDTSTAKNFDLDLFFSEFTSEKGIRRSIDKVFEIVVYALFNTLVRHLKVTITVSADPDERELLQGF